MEMKRVLRIVLEGTELRPVENSGERARKSAISFSPDQKGLVIAEPRETEPVARRDLAPV
jgi:hypothetical protein